MAIMYQVRVSNYKSFNNNKTDLANKDLMVLTVKNIEEVEKTKTFLINTLQKKCKINIKVIDTDLAEKAKVVPAKK